MLIAVNAVVFAWQLSFPNDRELELAGIEPGIDQSVVRYGASPYRITHPGSSDCAFAGPDIVCEEPLDGRLEQAPWWLTPLTAMFMAGSLLQLAVNALFLWLFGKSVEGSLGRARFLALYVLAGLAGVYLLATLNPGATAPVVGATAPVAGVLGAYAIVHARAAILCMLLIPFFVTFVEIPALIVIASRFVLQLVPSIGETSISGLVSDSGLAYAALIGGFALGVLAGLLVRARGQPPLEPAQAVY